MAKIKSIEEKAKAYDEALERAKHSDGIYPSAKELKEYIFPELRESEDERMKEAIIATIHLYYGEPLEDEAKEMIAWVEKQGEPKFKVGDWIIVHDKDPYQVKEINKYDYRLKHHLGGEMDYPFKYEESLRLWAIQDAKAGDVISFNDGHGNDCVELIKSITDTKKDKKIEFWFCLTNNEMCEVFDGICPYTNMTSREDAVPATKEQRDLLFQKIKEAGYEWDAEKKELKKIEQKPSEWSEEDENMLGELLDYCDISIAYNGKGTLQANVWEQRKDWLKSLKERYAWKPSDEQMEAIKDAIEFLGCTKKVREDLKSLYEHMKKLREE